MRILPRWVTRGLTSVAATSWRQTQRVGRHLREMLARELGPHTQEMLWRSLIAGRGGRGEGEVPPSVKRRSPRPRAELGASERQQHPAAFARQSPHGQSEYGGHDVFTSVHHWPTACRMDPFLDVTSYHKPCEEPQIVPWKNIDLQCQTPNILNLQLRKSQYQFSINFRNS